MGKPATFFFLHLRVSLSIDENADELILPE
jgi:hypothetical protein